jgi:hypothetical protein
MLPCHEHAHKSRLCYGYAFRCRNGCGIFSIGHPGNVPLTHTMESTMLIVGLLISYGTAIAMFGCIVSEVRTHKAGWIAQ